MKKLFIILTIIILTACQYENNQPSINVQQGSTTTTTEPTGLMADFQVIPQPNKIVFIVKTQVLADWELTFNGAKQTNSSAGTSWVITISDLQTNTTYPYTIKVAQDSISKGAVFPEWIKTDTTSTQKYYIYLNKFDEDSNLYSAYVQPSNAFSTFTGQYQMAYGKFSNGLFLRYEQTNWTMNLMKTLNKFTVSFWAFLMSNTTGMTTYTTGWTLDFGAGTKVILNIKDDNTRTIKVYISNSLKYTYNINTTEQMYTNQKGHFYFVGNTISGFAFYMDGNLLYSYQGTFNVSNMSYSIYNDYTYSGSNGFAQTLDNLKVFDYVVADTPDWDYQNGSGNEMGVE